MHAYVLTYFGPGPWPPSLPYRKSLSVDSSTVEGRIVAGKNASQMPLYHLAKLETKVVGAATGPGSGLLSLEKSSSEHVESGRCMHTRQLSRLPARH